MVFYIVKEVKKTNTIHLSCFICCESDLTASCNVQCIQELEENLQCSFYHWDKESHHQPASHTGGADQLVETSTRGCHDDDETVVLWWWFV